MEQNSRLNERRVLGSDEDETNVALWVNGPKNEMIPVGPDDGSGRHANLSVSNWP